MTTFSPGNCIRYFEAPSCYGVIGYELQADSLSVEGHHLRNIPATVFEEPRAWSSLYLHKSQQS